MSWAAGALGALLLAACNCTVEVPPERLPRFEPAAARPRVALVLGSGGHRGFAHIGVLKVLDEEGLKPDLVVGSSVGALVGALYASGMSGAELERLALELNLADFFMEWRAIAGFPVSGYGLQAFVRGVLGNRTIESLAIPFAAATTRASDKQLVGFNRGDVALAVRASGASPGLFDPVKISDEAFLDGDETSPVPILLARRLGAVSLVASTSRHTRGNAARRPARVGGEGRAPRAAGAPRSATGRRAAAPDLGYYVNPQEPGRRRAIAVAELLARARIDEIRTAFTQARSRARMPSAEASR